jgi:histidine triad (HIT) family protein
MSECLFCRIASGELTSDEVASGDTWLAFRDIDPQAPAHVLVIPRRHVTSLNELAEEQAAEAAELLLACRQVAEKAGIGESGYRVVINTNRDGGQLVPHLHLHVLGGRVMEWPPG